MSLRRPSLALGSMPVFARRLSIFGVATVNRKFRAKPESSGFEAFPAARHFPFSASGRGFKQSACATAFPANPSNPPLNPTDLMAVELAPSHPTHSGYPAQNTCQKHMFLPKRNVHSPFCSPSKQASISIPAPDLYTDAVYRITTWRMKHARIV